MKIMTEYYYSNCLIEAIKAKIKNPKVKIIVIMPWDNEVICPHFMWYDGIYVYDFGIEKPIPLITAWTIHKGHIIRRTLNHTESHKITRWKGRIHYARRIS